MYLKNNVNHKNMLIIWHYLKNFAFKKGLPEKDVNIFEQLSLSYPDEYNNALQYYTDHTQWSPHDIYVKCYLKAKEIVGESHFFRSCGRTVIKFNSVKSLKDIAMVFSGPGEAYKSFPTLLKNWNDTKEGEILLQSRSDKSTKKTRTVIKYEIHPHIPYENDYCSGYHIQGILESIPTIWPRRLWQPWNKLPMASVKQVMVQYDPVKLFNSIYFKAFNFKAAMDGEWLSINDPITKNRIDIGRRVFLVKSKINNTEEYIGEYSYLDADGDGQTGILITRTVEVGGEIACEKNAIFKAPCFIFEIQNEELPIVRRILSFRNRHKLNQFVLNEVSENIGSLRKEISKKEQANESLLFFKKQLEGTISEKKQELKATQQKIIEEEKALFENQISGGFVHEVRNGLVGSQLAISSLADYDGSGRNVKQVLDETLDRIVNAKGLSEKIKSDVRLLKKIILDANVVLLEIETAIESVLSLTRKIRFYTNAADSKTGDERVSIGKTLNIISIRQKRLLKKNNIELNIKGPEIIVLADQGVFISIFENIVINAIDAISEKMSEGGVIDIETGLDSEAIVLIRDNGMGIQKEYLNKIFDPFFTEKTHGSGLGLSIVKRFVDLYDGKINVKSDFGIGTEITVRFNKSILWRNSEGEKNEQAITDPGC